MGDIIEVLRCHECGELVMFKEEYELAPGRYFLNTRDCRCMRDEAASNQADLSAARAEFERNANRRACFKEYADFKVCTFERDDGKEPVPMRKAGNFAANFGRFRKDGAGLLLHGSSGTGKTFTSACIANAVIDQGYTVMLSNFASLVARIQAETYKGQNTMREVERCDLLIIDDLGIERSSSYMQEQVYNVIDARYRLGKPMVVSTNIVACELANPRDVSCERIYSRILEKCLPVEFTVRRRTDVRKDELAALLDA